MEEIKILKVSELIGILKSNNFNQLCKVEDLDDKLVITLCGLCKVVYLKEEDRYVSYRAHMYAYDSFKWIKLSKYKSDRLYNGLYVYYTAGGTKERIVFRRLMLFIINSFLRDVFKLGYLISDKSKVVTRPDCYCCYEGEFPECGCSSKVAYSTKSLSAYRERFDDIIFGEYEFTSITGKMIFNGHENISGKLTYEIFTRFYHATFNQKSAWWHASKSLGAAIRKTVNLEKVNLILRIYKKIHFSHVTLRDYEYFRSFYTITCKPDSLFSLLTINEHPKQNKKHIFYDGSNVSIINVLNNFDIKIARSEVKTLRRMPVSFVLLAKHVLRDGITELDVATKTNRDFIFELFRFKKLKLVPVVLMCRLVVLLLSKKIENHSCDNLIRFMSVWVEGNYLYTKSTPFNIHDDFWYEKTREFDHALDWLIDSATYLNKNQDWQSILRAVEKWDEERRNLHIEDELAELGLNDVEWSVNPLVEGFKETNFYVKELNSPRMLWAEGYEQDHCVYNYYSYCIENRYRVFKVNTDKERATLGVHFRPKGKVKYQLDQLYGYQNSRVSDILHKQVEEFIRIINN